MAKLSYALTRSMETKRKEKGKEKKEEIKGGKERKNGGKERKRKRLKEREK
jgi:hypothetical protein